MKSKQNCTQLLLRYRILLRDIFKFLGLDYRDASLITLHLVVIGNRIFFKSDEYDDYIT